MRAKAKSSYLEGQGNLDEHEKLVSVIKEVDVVISAVAFPQVLDQFKILEAIKVAGNIKRFLPSDFGVEEDKISVLPPFETFLNKKRKIRRAIEEANIPYTFVSANCFASYFVNYLLHPSDPKHDEITVYGTGEAKFVMNYEEDIGLYTIKVATDPRTCNQLPEPENIPVAILHSVFIKGVTTDYDFSENDVEASTLYPDLKFTTVDEVLDVFLHDPPKPASAAFA
ncbi:hypothetical protein C2S52_014190 [Perilla frutescens var. hirtella]|nr:hypothetical protein C2S52_014190 [Perilla frutescens var. hirtella]